MLSGEARLVSLRDMEEQAKEKLKLEVALNPGLADDPQGPDELSVQEANLVRRAGLEPARLPTGS